MESFKTFKMNPVNFKPGAYIDLNIKILNSKLVIIRNYQNTKIFLERATPQTGLKMLLYLKKPKIL